MTVQEISRSQMSPKVVTLIARMEARVHAWIRQTRLRKAIKRAYARFALEHPKWVAGLFDEHFLLHRAWAMLSREMQPSAPALALAWYAQCASPRVMIGDAKLAEATAVAQTFLTYLDEELQPVSGRQATTWAASAGSTPTQTAR